MSSQLMFRIIDKLVEVSIAEAGSQSLRSAFEDWYRRLSTKYSEDTFIHQVEQDTILFVETTYLDRNYLVDYFVSGAAEFSARSIVTHEVVQPLTDFLKGNSAEKPPQVSELDYFQLLRRRQSGDRQAYLARLYRISNLYHPAMEIMDRVVTLSLTSRRLAGIASNLPRYQLSETVIERTLFHIKNKVGLLRPSREKLEFP